MLYAGSVYWRTRRGGRDESVYIGGQEEERGMKGGVLYSGGQEEEGGMKEEGRWSVEDKRKREG